MYPFYNPYSGMQQSQYQMQAQAQQIVKVNGEPGARAYQMAPNSSVLLLDELQPIVWLKTTDGAGYPQLTPYRIEPYEREPEPDLRSIEERITRLEEALDGKPNTGKNGK